MLMNYLGLFLRRMGTRFQVDETFVCSPFVVGLNEIVPTFGSNGSLPHVNLATPFSYRFCVAQNHIRPTCFYFCVRDFFLAYV